MRDRYKIGITPRNDQEAAMMISVIVLPRGGMALAAIMGLVLVA